MIFNSTFYNPEFYRPELNNRGALLVELEENKIIKDALWEDVANLCLTTDICKSLNISFFDIMEKFDMASYSRMKEIINEDNERKAASIEGSRREMEEKLNQGRRK